MTMDECVLSNLYPNILPDKGGFLALISVSYPTLMDDSTSLQQMASGSYGEDVSTWVFSLKAKTMNEALAEGLDLVQREEKNAFLVRIIQVGDVVDIAL